MGNINVSEQAIEHITHNLGHLIDHAGHAVSVNIHEGINHAANALDDNINHAGNEVRDIIDHAGNVQKDVIRESIDHLFDKIWKLIFGLLFLWFIFFGGGAYILQNLLVFALNLIFGLILPCLFFVQFVHWDHNENVRQINEMRQHADFAVDPNGIIIDLWSDEYTFLIYSAGLNDDF